MYSMWYPWQVTTPIREHSLFFLNTLLFFKTFPLHIFVPMTSQQPPTPHLSFKTIANWLFRWPSKRGSIVFTKLHHRVNLYSSKQEHHALRQRNEPATLYLPALCTWAALPQRWEVGHGPPVWQCRAPLLHCSWQWPGSRPACWAQHPWSAGCTCLAWGSPQSGCSHLPAAPRHWEACVTKDKQTSLFGIDKIVSMGLLLVIFYCCSLSPDWCLAIYSRSIWINDTIKITNSYTKHAFWQRYKSRLEELMTKVNSLFCQW